MTAPLDLSLVGRTLQRLIERDGRPVALRDEASGQLHWMPPELVGAPDALLPNFLSAADVVWRAATGRHLGIEQTRDPDTLLGYRVKAIRGEPFSVVMLSAMEAVARTARPDMLVVNDLGNLWRELRPFSGAPSTTPTRTAAGPSP